MWEILYMQAYLPPQCKSNRKKSSQLKHTKRRYLINAGLTQMPLAATVLSVISHSIRGAERQTAAGLVQGREGILLTF